MSGTESLCECVLTKQQKRAMRSFLWVYGSEGFDEQASDGSFWDQGVRPWPTAKNLVAKGLIEVVQWWGQEEGNEYCLTEVGRDYMRALVSELGSEKGRRDSTA